MTSKFYKHITLSCIVIMLLLMGLSPAAAKILQPAVFLSSDKNGDGVAGIGDVLTVTCLCTSTDTSGQWPSVQCEELGTLIPLGQIAGTRYSTLFVVSSGNIDAAPVSGVGKSITFYFTDDETTTPLTRSINVDNRAPFSDIGPHIDSTQSKGYDSTFIVGDEIVIDLDLNVDDGDVVFADLSGIGLSTNYPFNATTSSTGYKLRRRVPVGKEASSVLIPVTAVDNAGNAYTWKRINIDIDTIAPRITSCTVVSMAAGDKYITEGDSLKLQVVVDNYDGDTVVASNTLLFNSPQELELVTPAQKGGTAVFEYTHFVTEKDIQLQHTKFDVTVTDDAGNQTKKTSNYIILDTLSPMFQTVQIEIVNPKGLLPNTAIVNDVLRIFGDLAPDQNGNLMKDVVLTVDLSAIGGAQNAIVPFRDNSFAPNLATTSFELFYTIPQGSSENNIPRTFKLTAEDKAGNEVRQVTLPVHYVDNVCPRIAQAQLENITSGGSKIVKHGDSIKISAVVDLGSDKDNGVVTADLSRIGGDTQETLLLTSANRYTMEYIVTSDSDSYIDSSVSFPVTVVDDAGNKAMRSTNSINIDTEIPVIEIATFTVSPALNETNHPYVKVNDQITFKVKMASSTATIHDFENVKIDLRSLGGKSDTVMEYSAGWYTYKTVIKPGYLNYDEEFRVVAEDNAGNAVARNIIVPIDNREPLVGNMAVNFLTNKSALDKVNVGDVLEFIIPVSEDADLGSCSINLSMIGPATDPDYGQVVLSYMDYDDTRKRYYLTRECKPSTMANPSYVFTATVYDKAGNSKNSLSAPFSVDCVCPAFKSNFVELSNSTKKRIDVGGTLYDMAVVGTDLTFTVEVDTSFNDHLVPTLNLTKLGGSSKQEMNEVGDGVYTYKHRVSQNVTDGELLKIKCTLTDKSGNEAYCYTENQLYVDNCPIQLSGLTYVHSKDDNGNGIVNLGAETISELIMATDTVTISVEYSSDCTIAADLTEFGYPGFVEFKEENSSLDGSMVITINETPTGSKAEMVFMPRKGSTNGKKVYANIKAVDPSGNSTIIRSENYLIVDNFPPRFQNASISLATDNGNLGEANLNDVVQIKVTIYDNDRLEPFVDFSELYKANNLTPPDWVIFPTSGSNNYTYLWTIKEKFGTASAIAIIASDGSGNKTVEYVNKRGELVFLSKEPKFKYAYAELLEDRTPEGAPNGIINPGDKVKFTCAFDNLYTANVDPYIPAKVLVDIRGIANSTSPTILGTNYEIDGDAKAIWLEMTRSTASPMVYTGEFEVVEGDTDYYGMDTDDAKFNFVVLHPTDYSKSQAKYEGKSRDGNPLSVDTKLPKAVLRSYSVKITDDGRDNPSDYVMNIGDLVTFETEINDFADPASVTLEIHGRDNIGNYTPIFRTMLLPRPTTNKWFTSFVVGTGTEDIDIRDYDVWNKSDGLAFAVQVIATDDADNTAQATLNPRTMNPGFTLDNVPPTIVEDSILFEIKDSEKLDPKAEKFRWIANVADGTDREEIESDALSIKVMISGTASYAYVDFSSIGATSTYMLHPVEPRNPVNFETIDGVPTEENRYVHFRIPESALSSELATFTLPIYVVDKAGNRSKAPDLKCRVPIDSRRPELIGAKYGLDGISILTLSFDDKIWPGTFDYSKTLRIGRTRDCKGVSGSSANYVQIASASNDLMMNTDVPSSEIQILLGAETSGKISGWKSNKLYVSIAYDDTADGESEIHKPIARDEGGNWLVPISRIISEDVLLENEYLNRPNLISGAYDGSNPDESDYLYLTFDKPINGESIKTETLNRLAIWYNTGSSNETLINRYRLNQEYLGDVYNTEDQAGVSDLNTIRIRISEQTKQWIAVTFRNDGSQIRFQIKDSKDKPLIRDSMGNRVNEILWSKAVPGTLTPLKEPFSISGAELDLSDAQNPRLIIHSNDRKIRVYENGYNGSKLPLTTPLDLSGIVICSTDNTATGKYMSLGTFSQTTSAIVNWKKFKEMNTEFASNSIIIPLESDALKTMLSWGTKDFYLSANQRALKDIWGNGSDAYPDQYGTTAALIDTILPSISSGSKPKIYSAAVMPISKKNSALFKGQPAGSLYYEVAFDTANVSTDVKVPIDRSFTPNMYLYRQSDWDPSTLTLRPGASPLDTGVFVNWLEHVQGGYIRTAIRYVSSSSLLETGAIDREPVIIYLDSFRDVFGNETVSNPGTGFNVASYAYDLSKKMDSAAYISGFDQNASYPMELDNCKPSVVEAVTYNLVTRREVDTIGVLAAGNLKVSVTFTEDMDTDSYPVLTLKNNENVVMTFSKPSWVDKRHAEYTNASAFTGSTTQGFAVYCITGGLDEAGNLGAEINLSSKPVLVRSKGPDVQNFTVTTLRSTTANSSVDYVIGDYYSPMVKSIYNETHDDANIYASGDGIATITINFVTQPKEATGTVAIYPMSGGAPVAELEARPVGGVWQAAWNGFINGSAPAPTAGQTTYEIRFYDQAGNEGSSRGRIIYDTFAPRVVTPWSFPNDKIDSRGRVHSDGESKIETVLSAAEPAKIRLYSTSTGYQLYNMSNSSGTTLTLNFNGKDNTGSVLAEGEYALHLVDMAGNLGVKNTDINEISSATLIIDRTAPIVTNISMYRKGMNYSLDEDRSVPASSFNSNRNYMYIGISESGGTMIGGTGFVRILAGSETIRELPMKERPAVDSDGTKLYVIWDGKDSNGNQVEDGTYTMNVLDLAGNQASYSDNNTISVVKSVFKVEGIEQNGTRGMRISFNQNLASEQKFVPPSSFVSVAGLTISSAAIDEANPKAIVATFSTRFPESMHEAEYLVSVVPDSVVTEEGDTITAGYNTGKFVVDAKGPKILGGAPNYEGITSQKEFNLIFDEQVVFDLNTTSSPAINPANYSIITTDGSNMTVDSIIRGSDVKTVKLTVSNPLSNEVTYTLTASNITDKYGNKGSSTISFVGRDVTPPNITLTAFSNPANEYDVTILLGSDEMLGADPLVTVAQSGTQSMSSALRLVTKNGIGIYKYIYSGGVHLSSSYSGVASIKALAVDRNNNQSVKTIYFTMAFINASLRASVESHDGRLKAVFEPGVLKKDSMVMIMPENLNSIVTGEKSASIRCSMNGSLTGRASSVDKSADELVPVATEAYRLVVPKGSLKGVVPMIFKTDGVELGSNVGLYCDEGDGWKPVEAERSGNDLSFSGRPGIYSLMQDVMAPRMAMIRDITKAPVTNVRPIFFWSINEHASGVDKDSACVVLDGKRYGAIVDPAGKQMQFMPVEALSNGRHDIAVRLSDKAGNSTQSESVRFDVAGSLEIYQVVQYPNPAKRSMKIRFTTNLGPTDFNGDNIRIRIYDSSGHLVANNGNLDLSAHSSISSKYWYEARWDLTNRKGKRVANGVYFAKIDVVDSLTGRKSKFTKKLAVLR